MLARIKDLLRFMFKRRRGLKLSGKGREELRNKGMCSSFRNLCCRSILRSRYSSTIESLISVFGVCFPISIIFTSLSNISFIIIRIFLERDTSEHPQRTMI